MKPFNASERPPKFWNNFDTRRMCYKCGDSNYQPHQSTLELWAVKMLNCIKCGCELIGTRMLGAFWDKKNLVTFGRRHIDGALVYVHRLRTFRNYSIHMNLMFSYVRSMMDMNLVRGGDIIF